jgi:hypothetical protein
MTNTNDTTNPPPDGLPEQWHGTWDAMLDAPRSERALAQPLLVAIATERKARLEAEAELALRKEPPSTWGVSELDTRWQGLVTEWTQARAQVAQLKQDCEEAQDQAVEHLHRADELGQLLRQSEAMASFLNERVAQLARERDEARAELAVAEEHARLRLIKQSRAASERDALEDDNTRLRELLEEARDALEKATAGVWDGHYGKGLSVAYAQSVESLVKGVTDRIDAELSKGGKPAKDGE